MYFIKQGIWMIVDIIFIKNTRRGHQGDYNSRSSAEIHAKLEMAISLGNVRPSKEI